ncbi:nuclear transport factor 2 family protein [Sporosarcina saromensis]|uniref:Nuclear transport factor 2 family protein n=1 Tax=Sporosarcina saromensis TaxID=359365 RepID=A0ABU4G859_9BACL|nr:nuclear transport factor 2 family protein [Sporosarcina saromensis]MDW0112562.1 nuclear transport factor 2 family protein [Sporosarcina saromensis]
MKKTVVYLMLVFVLVLSACSKNEEDNANQGSVNDGETSNEFGSIDHGVDENKVGFNLSGGEIEEAADVPAEEKTALMEAFDTYIHAFNAQDVDEYMRTLSKNPQSFSIDEERTYIEGVFGEYEISRDAKDVTIVKYDADKGEAQVFSNLDTTLKQKSSGLETNRTGRQVTVFTKEDGNWKVTSVYYMEDQPSGEAK